MWHETAVDKNLVVLWLVFLPLRCHLDMYKIMAACLDDSRLMEHRSTYWWHQTAQLTVDGDALVGFFFYIYFYLHAQTNGLEQTMMLSWYTLLDTIYFPFLLCTAEPLVNMITKYFRYDFEQFNAYTLDSIRTWTCCILLSLIWLTFVCVMLVFFSVFSVKVILLWTWSKTIIERSQLHIHLYMQ